MNPTAVCYWLAALGTELAKTSANAQRLGGFRDCSRFQILPNICNS